MIKKMLTGLIACWLLTGLGNASVFAQELDYKGFPQWSWHQEDSTEYYLYTPNGMQSGKKYPVALFLHGCCGESYHASLRNTVDPPVRMWHNFGSNTQSIPTYILAPATARGWKQHFKNLKKVIDNLVAEHNADPQRIYVCGFSMGAEGTFGIIQEYPGFFAAAITMGMSFRGDSVKVKDIPLWTNQGETDWYSRFLKNQVASIRRLNGYGTDTGSTSVTGVNPRYSNFKGVGHGVQWNAASTQNLTGWAYSKINDGNSYPIIFFEKPFDNVLVKAGEKMIVAVKAYVPGDTIQKIAIYLNEKLVKVLTRPPFITVITPVKGDNFIRAVAVAGKGKTSTAVSRVKVRRLPQIMTEHIPSASLGSYYAVKLTGAGNGTLHFSLANQSELPEGLDIYNDGMVKGIPLQQGLFHFNVVLKDEDDEQTRRQYDLAVNAKSGDDILVTDAKTAEGKVYKISKLMKGEAPNFNSRDSILPTELEEINFSNTGRFDGLTYIKTDVNDTAKSAAEFLSFTVDKNAVVYVAYEKLDNVFRSTVPGWLKDWQKEDDEIVAQYRYFTVYRKEFPAGKIILPGAEATRNGVGCNYFVMIAGW